MKDTFGADQQFLETYTQPILLKDEQGKAQIIISPEHQARVFTSTTNGPDGRSIGWINHALIQSGEQREHINAYGGEDRIWLGPEGGQYSIYFSPGAEFKFENWQVPACIDTEPFETVEVLDKEAIFRKSMQLVNYSGTTFCVDVSRRIRLYDEAEIKEILGVETGPETHVVGYHSKNQMRNTGDFDWKKENGLLSLWIIGMYKPSPRATIVIPFSSNEAARDRINDEYFGRISRDRLIIKDGVLFMKGDGQSRGKIGVPPEIVKPVMGSYDPENEILTIVQFDFHSHFDVNEEKDYVNSLWRLQDHPYKGDVVNAYNDGPINDQGDQLGPFYELETSSPAKALQQEESIEHTHRTFHFEGSKANLDAIAGQVLGVDLDTIANVF